VLLLLVELLELSLLPELLRCAAMVTTAAAGD
jgi:hypothetical protein